MEAHKVFYKIFGENFTDEINKSESDSSKLSNESILDEYMAHLPIWLQKNLDEIDSNERNSTNKSNIKGRLGPNRVCFDIEQELSLRISEDYLTVQSNATFATIKANICVFEGQWMYEIQLHSKGVMQIGFCSNRCSFSTDTGVGDTNNSYSFDGSKQQIWHVSTSKYGEAWQIGDIIGVCLDMDNEIITYYRNGESMGTAFTSIGKGPGIALFPAISLAFNEEVRANFGGTPFHYPIANYKPFQLKPVKELEKSNLLFGYLMNMSAIMSRPKHRKNDKKNKDGKSSSKNATYISIASQIMDKLVPYLMNAYVIEDKLYQYVKNLCVLRSEADKDAVILPGSPESTLGTLLTIFWTCLEEFEIHFILNSLLNMLISWYSQTPKDLEYERQRTVIVVLTCLCNHPRTRKYYIENRFFIRNCLPILLYLRPPEYSAMIELLPDDIVWTKGIGGSEDKYYEACNRLKKSTEPLYGLQKNLLMTLLCNNDGDLTTGSSRKCFIVKLRKYVMENSLEHRAFFLLHSSNHTPIESPIALSFICLLIDIVSELFQTELNNGEKIEVQIKYFLDGSFKYNHFDRIGGVLSHLRKVYVHSVDIYLGDGYEIMNNYENTDIIRINPNDAYSQIFTNLENTNIFSILGRATSFPRDRIQETRIIPGNINEEGSINELLDMCVIYYYAVGHKHVLKIVAVRDEIESLNEVLEEAKQNREDVEDNLKAFSNSADTSFNAISNEILKEMNERFGQRTSVFAKRSIELARKQAWYRAVSLGNHRRNLLTWLLDTILTTLKTCSSLGNLFSFVPEVYINILPLLLDSVIDFSIHDFALQFDLHDIEDIIKEAAEFLGKHAADSRIALAACKDCLLHALGTVITHEIGVKAMEKTSQESQLLLIKALLRPYENRAWGQSNWLLLRFWLGHGFAYRDARPPSVWQGGKVPLTFGLKRTRGKNESHTGLLHHIAPAYPSKHFQNLISKLLYDDEPFATKFLNSVLSQLNWAFSEFILLLQELQNIANRQGSEVLFESRQLKICAMCFELTVSLMRSLEMIITIAPFVFQDTTRSNSDLILNRICQLVSQVLSRVTIPPGCFQFVIDLCLPDLSSITHFSIITAALGILLSLFKDELNTLNEEPATITRISRTLLTDPSFQIANIEFVLGNIQTPIISKSDIPRGNFDPKMRAHIDPLTNDVRVSMPSTSKRIHADPPILKFSLKDYPTHVSSNEIHKVQKLIHLLQVKQTLLSDITLPSEDSLCPICCAKPIAVTFLPCQHQSCNNCILQHLMNSKVCFYCKTAIKNVKTFDGKIIYENPNYIAFQDVTEN